MPTCSAYACINRFSKKIPGITFHRFPNDPKRREQWVRALRRENWAQTGYSCVCSVHFKDCDFDKTSLCKVRIKEEAVSSVFPSFSQYLQKEHEVSKQWLAFSGDCESITTYLASRRYDSCWCILKFLDALFRGYGQVVFANNPFSGILIFIGLTVANPLVSAAGLLTASTGLFFSIVVVPQPPEMTGQGLTVFNPLLIGLVTAGTVPAHYGLELETWHWVFMVIAAVMSVYVASAFSNILGSMARHPLPYLTVPFNIVQQLLFLTIISISARHTHIHNTLTSPPLEYMKDISYGTSQPVALIPSSFVSNYRMNQLPEVITEPILPPSVFTESQRDGLSDGQSSKLSTEDVFMNSFMLNSSYNQHTFLSTSANFMTKNTAHSSPLNNLTSNHSLIEANVHKSATNLQSSEVTNENSSFDINYRTTSSLPESNHLLFEKNDDLENSTVKTNDEKENMTTLESVLVSDSSPSLEISSENYTYYAGNVTDITSNDQRMEILESDSEDVWNISSNIEPSTGHLYSLNTSSNFMDNDNGDNTDVVEETNGNSLRKRSITSNDNMYHSLSGLNNVSNETMEPVNLDWGGAFAGVVLSMSQVYAFNYAPTSLLIYLAVIIYSPIMAAFGVLGAALGTFTGILLTDADTYGATGGIYDGSWGFNGALCAMCLGGLFFVATWPAFLTAVLSSLLATVIQHIMIPSFAQADLSPMSLPFNLSALLFLCVTSTGALVRPKTISFPEKHRQEYRQSLRQDLKWIEDRCRFLTICKPLDQMREERGDAAKIAVLETLEQRIGMIQDQVCQCDLRYRREQYIVL